MSRRSNAKAVAGAVSRLRRATAAGDALDALEAMASLVTDFVISQQAWAAARAQSVEAAA